MKTNFAVVLLVGSLFMNLIQLFYTINIQKTVEPNWVAHNKVFYDALSGATGKKVDELGMLRLAIKGKYINK